MSEQDPDVHLMLAVRDDDHAAFEELFRRHFGGVTRYARAFVPAARAEEIAQDAFARVYAYRRSYQPRARFATWLYRIVCNLCVSELRRAEHRSTASRSTWIDVEAATERRERSDPSSVPSADEQAILRERVRRTRTALLELPPQQRAAVLLARVEGMSYAQIAESLGCSVGAVKSLVHRATENLRARLREEGETR